jgi:hypothetical protein
VHTHILSNQDKDIHTGDKEKHNNDPHLFTNLQWKVKQNKKYATYRRHPRTRPNHQNLSHLWQFFQVAAESVYCWNHS